MPWTEQSRLRAIRREQRTEANRLDMGIRVFSYTFRLYIRLYEV